MATRITGLDLGTYSLKVVHLELQRDFKVVGLDEERLPTAHLLADGPTHNGPAGDAQADGGGDFDNEATRVQQAPGAQPQDADVPEGADGQLENEAQASENTNSEHEPAWLQALDALASRGNFDGQWVVSYLPDGQAMTIRLEVPFDNKSKVTSILPHILMDRLPIDLRSVSYDFVVGPGPSGDRNDALVGFARKDHIAQMLSNTRSRGIDPVILGVPELMLRYVAERAAAVGTLSYAMLDIGHSFTRLLVMHQGQPVLARSVRIAGRDITEAIAQQFKLSFEDAERLKHARGAILPATEGQDPAMLALSDCIAGALRPLIRDMRRSFQGLYAQDRVKVENIYLIGGTSRLKNLEAFLTAEFSVPTSRYALENDEIFSDLGSSGGPGAGQFGAMGLASSLALQQAVDKQDRKLVNLRQGEFAFRGKSSFVRSQMMRIAAFAAVLVLLLAAFLATQRMEQRSQMEAMRAALLKQTTDLFGEPLDTQRKIEARLTGGQASDGSFVPKMSAYELMYNLVSRMPEDLTVELERLEVDTDRNLVQIIGVTSNAQAVDRIATELEQLKCLREVRKDRLQVRSETEVLFELHISSGCS